MTLKEAIALVNASGTHVVVPVEPDRYLFDAWVEAAWPGEEAIYADEFIGPISQFNAAYRAMLSASLTHSEGGE